MVSATGLYRHVYLTWDAATGSQGGIRRPGYSRGASGSDGRPGAFLQVEKRRVNLPRALSAPPVAGTACHAYDREVHLHCELGPGFYLAVPSTFLKDAPGRFLLRVFSTGRVALR